jgi:hypothetical protein
MGDLSRTGAVTIPGAIHNPDNPASWRDVVLAGG